MNGRLCGRKRSGMKIGFIGLGIMGAPMSTNLLKAGCELLVNDVSKEAVAKVVAAGGREATYEEIGTECGVVLTMLPTGAIVQQVLFGEGGVAPFMKPGTLVCDMSSVTPIESRTCQAKLAETGVRFVDAPCSGGEPGAIAGTLSFMCGGAEEDFEAVKPILLKMGGSAVRIGECGHGSIAKLSNQMIVNLTIAAVGEAFVFAQKCGADPEKVYQAIRGGLAGSRVLEDKAPMMCARNFKPGGKISINRKDIGNVLSTAKDMVIPVPFSAQLYEVMQNLWVNGQADEDHASIVKYFERLAGVEVRGGSQQ